jgi:outer membrane receptor for ferrienterochelin and colicin
MIERVGDETDPGFGAGWHSGSFVRIRRTLKRIRRCLLLAIAFGAPSAAQENRPVDLTELPLEELRRVQVVRAASRFDQGTREAPSSVSIVTAAEIR